MESIRLDNIETLNARIKRFEILCRTLNSKDKGIMLKEYKTLLKHVNFVENEILEKDIIISKLIDENLSIKNKANKLIKNYYEKLYKESKMQSEIIDIFFKK